MAETRQRPYCGGEAFYYRNGTRCASCDRVIPPVSRTEGEGER